MIGRRDDEDDPMDGGGRIASGTAIEEQLPRRHSRGGRARQEAKLSKK